MCRKRIQNVANTLKAGFCWFAGIVFAENQFSYLLALNFVSFEEIVTCVRITSTNPSTFNLALAFNFRVTINTKTREVNTTIGKESPGKTSAGSSNELADLGELARISTGPCKTRLLGVRAAFSHPPILFRVIPTLGNSSLGRALRDSIRFENSSTTIFREFPVQDGRVCSTQLGQDSVDHALHDLLGFISRLATALSAFASASGMPVPTGQMV